MTQFSANSGTLLCTILATRLNLGSNLSEMVVSVGRMYAIIYITIYGCYGLFNKVIKEVVRKGKGWP